MTLGGVRPLEEMIYNTAMSSMGNPAFIGLIIAAFFTAFVMLQGGRNDFKALMIGAGLILATAFIDWLLVLVALGAGFVLYLVLTKATQR